MEEKTKVFVKIDEKQRIIAINSGFFIADLDGWTEIDEGSGDKYEHAQNNYLNKPLFNEFYAANFKFMGGKIEERTAEEKEADRPDLGKTEMETLKEEIQSVKKIEDSKVEALYESLEFISDVIAEMGIEVYK